MNKKTGLGLAIALAGALVVGIIGKKVVDGIKAAKETENSDVDTNYIELGDGESNGNDVDSDEE